MLSYLLGRTILGDKYNISCNDSNIKHKVYRLNPALLSDTINLSPFKKEHWIPTEIPLKHSTYSTLLFSFIDLTVDNGTSDLFSFRIQHRAGSKAGGLLYTIYIFYI